MCISYFHNTDEPTLSAECLAVKQTRKNSCQANDFNHKFDWSFGVIDDISSSISVTTADLPLTINCPLPSVNVQPNCECSQIFSQSNEYQQQPIQKMEQKKKKVRRRRSSDFEVISTFEELPSSITETARNEADILSGARRSKRLFRKSLEIYRSNPKRSDGTGDRLQPDTSSNKDEDGIANRLEECASRVQKDENDNADVAKCLLPIDKNERVQCSPKSVVRKRNSQERKACSAEMINDIYLNKLWKSQMPVEKGWETIYEQPVKNSLKVGAIMSRRRLQRNINFDDFYTKKRLNKRRRKALQQGWKPPTAVEDEKFSTLLAKKLSELDAALDSS